MTTSSTAFQPPSPGAWELEQTHLTRPPSVFMASVSPQPMMEGFKEGTRTYGLLLDHLEVAIINRFLYIAPRAVGAPKSAKGPPPRFMFEMVRRLHPEVRRRVRLAETVFSNRIWRQDVERWDREWRPGLDAQARSLLKEDLAAFSDAQLADHVRRATAFLRDATFIHHRLNFCAMVPLGHFLISAMEWTGLSAGNLLQAMRGLSPVSAGALEELAALRQALLATPDAMALLHSGKSDAEILTALQARPDSVGAAARDYVDVVGLRILGGYDVADRHAREHPEMILKVIRAAVGGEDVARRAAAAASLGQIRERVPPEHRAQFDDLLAEAQYVYRVRDERGFYGDLIASGLARRAILAAGERLIVQGRASKAEDLVDASPDEIVALLDGRPGPSAAELAERARWRRETPLTAAPPALGFPPSPPPPPEWLPAAAGKMQRITMLVMSLMFDVHKPHADRGNAEPAESPSDVPTPQRIPLKGFAVSPGTYEGPARVIRTIEELPTVQNGEVLVASSTGAAFNVVLPLIGALVTERGGVLSHAAIVSREYGLPGIVGCVGAMSTLKTGMRVRVDGDKGEVWTIA